jgi:hypothetical protein
MRPSVNAQFQKRRDYAMEAVCEVDTGSNPSKTWNG